MSLAIERVPIESLHLDAGNVRRHDERNLAAIASSLRAFGQVEPLVVQRSAGRVIGGNGRLEALRSLGQTEVDVVYVDLDDTHASALGLALNRSAELASWDIEGLAALLKQLDAADLDLDATGFAEDDLTNLLNAEFSPRAPNLVDTTRPSPGSVRVTERQLAALQAAAALVRAEPGRAELSDGEVLEVVCTLYVKEHAT